MSVIELRESELDKFLTRQRDRHVEALQEALARKLKHTHDDAEAAIDYARKLIAEGADVSDALVEMQLMANTLLLMVGVLKLEAGR